MLRWWRSAGEKARQVEGRHARTAPLAQEQILHRFNPCGKAFKDALGFELLTAETASCWAQQAGVEQMFPQAHPLRADGFAGAAVKAICGLLGVLVAEEADEAAG